MSHCQRQKTIAEGKKITAEGKRITDQGGKEAEMKGVRSAHGLGRLETGRNDPAKPIGLYARAQATTSPARVLVAGVGPGGLESR